MSYFLALLTGPNPPTVPGDVPDLEVSYFDGENRRIARRQLPDSWRRRLEHLRGIHPVTIEIVDFVSEVFPDAQESWGASHWCLYEDETFQDAMILATWGRLYRTERTPWVREYQALDEDMRAFEQIGEEATQPLQVAVARVQTYQGRQVRAVHITVAGDYELDLRDMTARRLASPSQNRDRWPRPTDLVPWTTDAPPRPENFPLAAEFGPETAILYDIEADTYVLVDERDGVPDLSTRIGVLFRATHSLVTTEHNRESIRAAEDEEVFARLDQIAAEGFDPVKPPPPTLWERISDDADDNY